MESAFHLLERFGGVQFPATLSLSRADAEANFRWFLGVRAARLSAFRAFLQDRGVELTGQHREDLSLTANFIAEHARVVVVPSGLDAKFETPFQKDLDEDSLNISVYFGLLFGETLIAESTDLAWQLPVKDRRYAYYHCPVIRKTGVYVELNPLNVAQNFIRSKAIDKKPLEFLELYDRWRENLEVLKA